MQTSIGIMKMTVTEIKMARIIITIRSVEWIFILSLFDETVGNSVDILLCNFIVIFPRLRPSLLLINSLKNENSTTFSDFSEVLIISTL